MCPCLDTRRAELPTGWAQVEFDNSYSWVRSKLLKYSLVCTPLLRKRQRDAALASLRHLAAGFEEQQVPPNHLQRSHSRPFFPTVLSPIDASTPFSNTQAAASQRQQELQLCDMRLQEAKQGLQRRQMQEQVWNCGVRCLCRVGVVAMLSMHSCPWQALHELQREFGSAADGADPTVNTSLAAAAAAAVNSAEANLAHKTKERYDVEARHEAQRPEREALLQQMEKLLASLVVKDV